MLNEGYTLYKSLERCGISPPKRHPDIKKVGKKKGLIVGIGDNGKVTNIEFRNSIEMSKLWKISDGKKNSFPCMTLSMSLLNLDAYYRNTGKQITSKTDIDTLRNIWKQYGLNLKSKKRNEKEIIQPMFADWQSTIRKLKDRLAEVENIGEEANAYKVLLERILKFNNEESDREIATELTDQIFNNLTKGVLTLDDIQDFLVKEVPGSFIFFDVSDYEKFTNRVAGTKIVKFISDCLLKKIETKKHSKVIKNPISSALSGKPYARIPDKFPDPNLQIMVAQLFGVDKNTPCLKRYGQISTRLFPVDSEEANAIQDALIWITQEDRKGKTWYPVPGANNTEIDLLIVYLENKPDFIVNKAHLLGGVSKNDFSDSMYESVSKIAISAIKAEKIDKANDLIRLFAIHEADKMRRQISLQRIYRISELVKADENWQKAAQNIPYFAIPFFRKEIERSISTQGEKTPIVKAMFNDDKLKMILFSPKCPFPADLVRITQRQWIRGERDFTPVAGCSLGDIYDVFFANENEKKQLTEHLLNRTLHCTKNLLIDTGNVGHQKLLKKFSKDKRFTVLRTVSALAIYLYKLGIKKENYMKDTFFYVGQFLSLVDSLHFEWCKHVRGGYPEKEEKIWRKAIPPQLLGSSHLNIALDNPNSAFDTISRRLRIYKDWTNIEQSDTVALARWLVSEIREVSSLMSKKPNFLPTTTTSVERAQILLGYLSKTEKKSSMDSQPSQEENITIN